MSRRVPLLTSPKKGLRDTLILFIAVVSSVFFFMVAAVIVSQRQGPLVPALNTYATIFSLGMGALSFACLVAAKRIFNKAIRAAKISLNTLNDKLNQHRSALVKYLVICEVPVLLSILFFMLTGNFVFQVYAGVFLGFMLAMTPIRRRVVAELELDGQQQKELE
ncbi:MAG: hypothetical protein ACXWWD_02790 [Chitinophagaceae bacterium]